MKCPNCGGPQIHEYDTTHWQCACKWIFLKEIEDGNLPDLQEEDNEEASEEEETRRVETQAPCLEGEVKETGWEVRLVKQDESKVWFRVYCMDEERDWFKLLVKCPKSKFRKIGV
jgi:hypothetical protein